MKVPEDFGPGVTAPPSYAFSAQDQGGDDTRDSDVDPLTGLTSTIAYSAGTADRTVDAALNSKIFSDGFESGSTSMWSSTVT